MLSIFVHVVNMILSIAQQNLFDIYGEPVMIKAAKWNVHGIIRQEYNIIICFQMIYVQT